LTGRADLVTTIDIDPDVTAKATQALAATGYGDVHVLTGDDGLGYPDHALYDRMIATVSPWDIPPPSGGNSSLPEADWSPRCGSLSSRRVEPCRSPSIGRTGAMWGAPKLGLVGGLTEKSATVPFSAKPHPVSRPPVYERFLMNATATSVEPLRGSDARAGSRPVAPTAERKPCVNWKNR
jgi:protein-L-isoaspartate(D-aspartate) O-methyltransferase (PCMT)